MVSPKLTQSDPYFSSQREPLRPLLQVKGKHLDQRMKEISRKSLSSVGLNTPHSPYYPIKRRSPVNESELKPSIHLSFPKENRDAKPPPITPSLRKVRSNIELASAEQKEDPLFVKKAILNNPTEFRYAGPNIRKNRNFIRAMAIGGTSDHPSGIPEVLDYMDKSLKYDLEFAIKMVSYDSEKFAKFFDPHLIHHPDFKHRCVLHEPEVYVKYQKLDEKANDDAFLLHCLKKCPYAIDMICTLERKGGMVGNDKKFMQKALEIDFHVLEFASEALRNDSTFMLLAIQKNEKAYRFASQQLQMNRNFQKAAIQANISVARFISIDQDWKNDKIFMKKLLHHHPISKLFKFGFLPLSDELRNDKIFMLSLIQKIPSTLLWLSEDLKRDKAFKRELIQELFRAECQLYRYDLNPKTKIEKAIQKLHRLFRYPPFNEDRNDRTFMLFVIDEIPSAFLIASEELQTHQEFILDAIRANPKVLDALPEDMKKNPYVLRLHHQKSKELTHVSYVLSVVEEKPENFIHIPPILQEDEDFFRQAVKNNVKVFSYSSLENISKKNCLLKGDTQLASLENEMRRLTLNLTIENPTLFGLLPTALQQDESFFLEVYASNYRVFSSKVIRDIAIKNCELKREWNPSAMTIGREVRLIMTKIQDIQKKTREAK